MMASMMGLFRGSFGPVSLGQSSLGIVTSLYDMHHHEGLLCIPKSYVAQL
jgi:hypothetical protein